MIIVTYQILLQRGIEAGLVSRENEGTAVFSVNTNVPGGKEVRTEFILLS